MRIISTFFFIICFYGSVFTQNLYSINTAWDDDFKQWEIIANEGEVEGTIDMKWRIKNDVTEWTFRIENARGTILKKWDNNPNAWELRSMESTVSISTVWSGDFTAWRISDGDRSIKIERVSFQSDPVEWTISDEKDGKLFWYNEFQHDLRDWIIVDELSETVSFDMKLAAVFITIIFEVFN